MSNDQGQRRATRKPLGAQNGLAARPLNWLLGVLTEGGVKPPNLFVGMSAAPPFHAIICPFKFFETLRSAFHREVRWVKPRTLKNILS